MLAAEPPGPTTSGPPRPKPQRRRRPVVEEREGEDRGLLRPPAVVERTVRESLPYPLWGAPGVALLATMPPVLWLTSLLSVGLVPNYVIGQSDATAMGALTFIAPMLLALVLCLGYVGVFLERVLIDAAAGEVHHPKLPAWGLLAMLRSVFRLATCAALGSLAPAGLLIAYATFRGRLDSWERAVSLVLVAPGAVYAAVAWASVVLRDDVLGANPIAVVGAIVRLGWDGVMFLLGLSVPLALTALAVPGLFALGNTASGGFTLLATFVFWLAGVYEAMVLARVLGNFCRRERERLGWTQDRPRW